MPEENKKYIKKAADFFTMAAKLSSNESDVWGKIAYLYKLFISNYFELIDKLLIYF
mgnify:CR=1 FL=1